MTWRGGRYMPRSCPAISPSVYSRDTSGLAGRRGGAALWRLGGGPPVRCDAARAVLGVCHRDDFRPRTRDLAGRTQGTRAVSPRFLRPSDVVTPVAGPARRGRSQPVVAGASVGGLLNALALVLFLANTGRAILTAPAHEAGRMSHPQRG